MSNTFNEAALKLRQSKYRWVVLAAVWLLYASFGLCMRSLPPIVTPILRDLDMTYSQMGFILGSWQLVYIPVAVFAGFAIDKWGIRKSLFIGAMIIGFSEGLRYYATGFITLLPLVALFGIGGPLISIGAPKVVSSWFGGNNRATAVGIYTTAPWIGGLFSIAATNSIIMPLTGESWRLTLLYYGILTVSFAFVWVVLARDSSQGEVIAGTSLKESFIALVRVRNVRIVLAAGLLTLFVEHGFSHWLPKMLENRGFSPEDAGFLAAVPLIAAIPAVLLLPRFIPGHSRGRYIAVLSALASAGLLLSYIASSWMRTLGLIAYGISAPSLLPLLMLLLMEEPQVGAKHMGLAGGIFFCVAEVGGFTGPLLMGGLVDITDSFMPGIILFTVTGLILGLIILMVRANRTLE
ncbi:MAG: MFS transporter [Dehalococcoidales bacterium]|nr:MAG: MFS transporter [Dehalococcoidales bacterium]